MIPAASPAKRFFNSTYWGIFFVTPDEARRETRAADWRSLLDLLGLCVRARVRLVWRVKVILGILKKCNFTMLAFLTDLRRRSSHTVFFKGRFAAALEPYGFFEGQFAIVAELPSN